MDDIDVPVRSANDDAFHRELERRSQDTIRVYNPTDSDYLLEWDFHKHRVPAKDTDSGWGKGMRVLPRYMAEKYCREMKTQLINEMGESKVQSMLEDRQVKGMAEMSPFDKQVLYDKAPRTDDKNLIEKLYPTLWLGIEEEFGLDYGPDKTVETVEKLTTEEKVLKELSNKRYERPYDEVKTSPESTHEVSETSKGKKKILEQLS